MKKVPVKKKRNEEITNVARSTSIVEQQWDNEYGKRAGR